MSETQRSTLTYTLAIGADMLLATVIDGGDIDAAIAEEAEKTGFNPDIPYRTYEHCTLTDEVPDDLSRILWRSGNEGWIIDETGQTWRFAIKPTLTERS